MKALFSIGLCSLTCAAVGGEFVNLKFDEPDFSRLAIDPPTGSLSAPIGDMLPGWEVSTRPILGEWQPYTGLVDFSSAFGQSPVAVSTFFSYGSVGYSVAMQAIPAIGFPGPRPPDVRLSAKGTVPANAVTFDWYDGRGIELTVSDGFSTVARERDQTSMNVSQFAGKEVTISFLLRSGGSGGVDVIGFSLVPEPEMWTLLAVGLVGLVAWCRYRKA